VDHGAEPDAGHHIGPDLADDLPDVMATPASMRSIQCQFLADIVGRLACLHFADPVFEVFSIPRRPMTRPATMATESPRPR
jgi:hypothetical protein